MGQLQITTHQNAAVRTPSLPIDAENGRAGSITTASLASTFALDLLKRIFSFPAMLGSSLVGAMFVQLRTFQIDPDVWWHIKVGETILATHRFPTTDPYSFTAAGQPWLAYEWLGEVLLATVNRMGGLVGLDILLIAIGSAIMIALYAFATLVCGNSKAGFVATAILLLLAGVSFSLRPQMIGYFFLIITLILLERFRQGHHKSIWLLPPLMLLWVNTHGSWIIGLGTIFVYWISGLADFRTGNLEARRWSPDDRRRIAFSFLLCLLTLPITPYGTRIAFSPFEYAFSLPLNSKYIQEWQPMAFNLGPGKMFLGLLLAFILAQVLLGVTWELHELALCLCGITMACLHIRFLLIFVPFFIPFLARILARWMPRYEASKDKFALNAALMACLAAAMIYCHPSHSELQRNVTDQFPVKAVEYVRQHPLPGPTFNNYGYGGYLIWSGGPESKVFIDGRGDLYERGGVFSDYMHISELKPGALEVLRGYGVQSCLLERDEPLSTVLYASPDWSRVYVDNVSAVFVRTQR